MVEPTRIGGAIRKKEEYHHSQDERRQSFENKQPLPAVKAQHAIGAEDEARDRRADHIGQWYRKEIGRRITGAQPGRKPQRKIKDHPGRETGFRKAEQES